MLCPISVVISAPLILHCLWVPFHRGRKQRWHSWAAVSSDSQQWALLGKKKKKEEFCARPGSVYRESEPSLLIPVPCQTSRIDHHTLSCWAQIRAHNPSHYRLWGSHDQLSGLAFMINLADITRLLDPIPGSSQTMPKPKGLVLVSYFPFIWQLCFRFLLRNDTKIALGNCFLNFCREVVTVIIHYIIWHTS